MDNSIVVAVDNKPALLRPIAVPAEIIAHQSEVREFVVAALTPGKDYGKIPGTNDRLVLLKPGAEVICSGFGVRPESTIIESEVDHNHVNKFRAVRWEKRQDPGSRDAKEKLKAEFPGRFRNKQVNGVWEWQESTTDEGESLGLYRYVMRTTIFAPDGRAIGEGVGSASTMETKYIRSPRDAENTVLKMAKKRAFVDAVLSTFGLSDMYTQDVEDMAENKAARNESPAEVVTAEIVDERPVQQTQPTQTAPRNDPPRATTNDYEATNDPCQAGQILVPPAVPIMPGGFAGFDENLCIFGYSFPRKDAFGPRFPGWKNQGSKAQFDKFFATINFGPESAGYALVFLFNEIGIPIGLRESSAAISMAISFAVNCSADSTREFKDKALKFAQVAYDASKRYEASQAGGGS